jgi:hypothetical protein
MTRYALRDDQWERIEDLLPRKVGDVGVTAQNNRRFVEAVSSTDTPPEFHGATCRSVSATGRTELDPKMRQLAKVEACP